MSKVLAWFLMFVSLVGGILLGNQYGRRDVVNSRPPIVNIPAGNTPQESAQVRNIYSLLLYNPTDSNVYGSASIVQQNGAGEAAIYLQRLPGLAKDSKTVKVSLFSPNGDLVSDLGQIEPAHSSESSFSLPVSGVSQGQYLGFFDQNNNALLSSTRVQ